ncbi:MAG: GNAT family N-acetyltransferase [Lachnospiraceae bacterium]|nr:GNAT family N-acetyltransferase [Lachnospiraceae bacterium]
MEKFYLEVPGIARKDEALAYINEFYEYGSKINGAGGLNHFPDDYEAWLRMTEARNVMEPNEHKVPAREYFFVRESDNRIVGMINIRTALNERMATYGGHIGYSIRPTERGKGYNKINLYLALKVLNRYGIETALLDADLDNPASWRTMEALGGVRVRVHFEEEQNKELVDYTIDVRKALAEHEEFEEQVAGFRLETERLVLRQMTMDDFDALYAVLGDDEIMSHYPYAFDEGRVRDWIKRNMDRYQKYGYGLWAVCRKDTGEMIGDCGLTLQNIDGSWLPEIGYHIRADQQHKGYAKEAAAAVRDWAWAETSYPALYSYCKYTNIASYRTAEAIGMRFEREYPDEANGTTHVSVIERRGVERCEDREWLLSEAAYRLYAPCMYEPTYEKYVAEMEQFSATPATEIYVYRTVNYTVGMLVFRRKGTEAEIEGIAVDPVCRVCGIGRKMITSAAQLAGITAWYAETDADAVEFYSRSGFAVEEEVKEYPNGTVTRYHCRL